MTVDELYARPISPEALLQFKALTPLTAGATAVLAKVQALDVSGFNEAEVRAYVIDPIVSVLGYEKGSDFSVDLERKIDFLDAKKFPDYRFNLWREDFWLIEAKRPRSGKESFDYEDFSQAFEYACHPEIDAALIVLCDGEKIEVFDRELSVAAPVLRIARENLIRDFDRLRALLEPWQVWFFQKRRVVRLIDKVFSKEFNLSRVNEFKKLVDGRLNRLRDVVLRNYQQSVKSDFEKERDFIANASSDDLIDAFFFFVRSAPLINTMINTLVEQSQPGSFRVLYKMFPDEPRDANDAYFAHAAAYLMALADKRETVEWLPAWLSPGQQSQASVEAAARRLIRSCLTYFEGDEARRTILLAATALRRIARLVLMSSEAQWRRAEVMHFLHRYHAPELSQNQFLASPEGQAHRLVNMDSIDALYRFMAACLQENGRFNAEVAKQSLQGLWALERSLLEAIPNFTKLREERGLGEMFETASISFDLLGHSMLSVMPPQSRWRAYIQSEHRPELEHLASMGSSTARELLGLDQDTILPPATDEFLAARFFFGDVDTLQFLRAKYGAS